MSKYAGPVHVIVFGSRILLRVGAIGDFLHNYPLIVTQKRKNKLVGLMIQLACLV